MSPPSFRTLLNLPATKPTPSDSCLILIDAQKEYSTGLLKVTNHASSCAVIASLLEKYRNANGKVIHVLQKEDEGASVFTPGTELEEAMGGLEAKDGETVIHKIFPGAFEQTNLHSTLESWGIKKIVLVGYMAHVCVSTTAREGFQKGYEVVLVEDGIGDRDIPGVEGSELTRVALAELGDIFATVVKSDEVV